MFKNKDRVHINHHALSDYFSGLKDIPDTLHEHGRILSELDHSQLVQHLGQSIDSGRLPLISVTGQGTQPAKVAYEIHSDGYANSYVDDSHQSTPNIGYTNANNEQSAYLGESTLNSEYGTQPKPQSDHESSNQNNGYFTGSLNLNSEHANQRPQTTNGYFFTSSNSHDTKKPLQSNKYDPANQLSGYQGQSDATPYAKNGGSSSSDYKHETTTGYELVSAEEPSVPSDYNQNYVSENSPFDVLFVRDILNRVLQQLEQQQIIPEQLQAYAEPENKPSLGHYTSDEASPSDGNKPKSSLSSSAKYGENIQPPAYQTNLQPHHTVTYRMPTINYEMPLGQIDQLMQTVSGSNVYGTSSQQVPVVFSSNQLQLPSNLDLGKIRTIAVFKSSRLPSIKQQPQSAAIIQDGVEVGKLSHSASSPRKIRTRQIYQMMSRKNPTSRNTRKLHSKPCNEKKKK